MSQFPYGPPPPPDDEQESSGSQIDIEIEADQPTIDAGQSFLQAAASGQMVSPEASQAMEALPEGTTPEDAARDGRRQRLEEIQQARSDAQQRLDESDAALANNRADLALNSDETSKLKEEVSALERQQQSLAAYAMEQEGLLGWRHSWPWVSAFLDADNPNEGVLDTSIKYLEGLGVAGQIVSGVGRAVLDVPGRLGDAIYDMTATEDSTRYAPMQAAPFTRFSGGMPDSIAGSLSYNLATYVAPFVAGAGAGTAAAAGAGIVARIAAGTVGGFMVNRATDLLFDPEREGGAATAVRDMISMSADQSDDADAFMAEPRDFLAGYSYNDLAPLLSSLDSREYARTEGRFAGRLAIAGEGALLDLTLGAALVGFGVTSKAAAKGALAKAGRNLDTVREIRLRNNLDDAANLNSDVDPDAILEAIDEASLNAVARAGDDATSALDVRARVINAADRHLRYQMRQIRRGNLDPDSLTAPLTGEAIDAAAITQRYILNRRDQFSSAARVSALVSVRRTMAEQIRMDVREDMLRSSRYAKQEVTLTTPARQDGPTLRDQRKNTIAAAAPADAGRDPSVVREGVADFARVGRIDAGEFRSGIELTSETHKFGPAVEAKPLEYYEDPTNRVFMSDDGYGGAVVSADGDLVSVYKVPGSSVDVDEIIYAASRHAITGDAYDIGGFLPAKYAEHGFRVAARVKFNPEYMPKGWNLDEMGQPDIVLLVRDPDGVSGLPIASSVEEWQSLRDQVPLFEDWDEAAAARDRVLRDGGIVAKRESYVRQATDPNKSPDPVAESLEVERRLDERGLSLAKLEGDFEEYIYQMMIDPANGFAGDASSARMQARFAARTGQMMGVNLNPDDIREIDRAVAGQIIGMPNSTARTLFQKSSKDPFAPAAAGMATDMIRDMMDVPAGMKAGVDLNNVVGDEAAILLRPRPESGEDLMTMKGGRYAELAANEGDPEMAGMRPITDEELDQIHRDSVMEMVESGLLPEAYRGQADPVQALQDWIRGKHTTAPTSRKDWVSLLGASEMSGKEVVGFKNITNYSGIGLDPTYGLTPDDITQAMDAGRLSKAEGKFLTEHMASQPEQRRMLLTLNNAEFWNRALTSPGADRGRFWYQRGSERLFGTDRPIINPEGMPTGWLQRFNDMLSITSARTAVDLNWLKATHNFSTTVLLDDVPLETDALGRHSKIRLASVGIGAEDSDNYKVNNFGIANSSTKPKDQLPYNSDLTSGRADPSMGASSHYDLPVNDVIMAGSVFRVDEKAWASYTLYQLAVRQQRRLRNLLNGRRAELERTNPLPNGPREVWEMREIQSLPWDTYVASGVDSKSPDAAFLDNFNRLGLKGADGVAPDERPRAKDFVEAAEQMIEVLRAHPKTSHYYKPGGKFYADGTPYLDREVLGDPAVWDVFQPTPRRKANSAVLRMTYDVLDRLTPPGETPLSQRVGALLAIRDNPVAQSLNKTNFTALVKLGTAVMEGARDAIASITRARVQPTPSGRKNTVTVGEAIAAILNRKAPEVTAATKKEDVAIVKQSMQPSNVVDDSDNPYVWRLGGSMSVSPDGTLVPEFLVNFQTIADAEERRLAAAAVSYATNEPYDIVKYVAGPVVDRPSRIGPSQSFEAMAASGNQTIRNLNSGNAATRQHAEQNTVLTVEIRHPDGNAGKRLVEALKTPSPNAHIIEQGGQVIRFHGNSKREIYEEIRSVADQYGVSKIRLDALDEDSFTMSPTEARDILGDRLATQVLRETSDAHFLNNGSLGVAATDMTYLRVLNDQQRAQVFGLGEGDEALLADFRATLASDDVITATRQLIKHYRDGNTARLGGFSIERQGHIAAVWQSMFPKAMKFADDGTFSIGRSDDLLAMLNNRTAVNQIVTNGAEMAVKNLSKVMTKVRSKSVAYRQRFWLDRMTAQLGDVRGKVDDAFRRLDEYNNDTVTFTAKGDPVPPARPKILRELARGGHDAGPFLRFQQVGDDIRGVTFAPEQAGYAMIRGFNNGDVSTGIEELTHAIRVVATSRARRSPSYTTAEFDSLAQAVGVKPGGTWSIAADEDLASMMKDLVLKGEVPNMLPARAKWVLEVMAAELRDVWRDGTAAGAAGLTASAGMRQDVINRLETMPLPIRVGEGRYMPAVDWSDLQKHVRSLRAEGKNWQDVIDMSDILAHARIFQTDQRGLFTPGSARQTILSDKKARAAMRQSTHFPKGTREEMFEAMAYFEDFVRSMRNSDPMLQRADLAAMRDKAVRDFGQLVGHSADELHTRLDDLMRVDLRDDQLAQRVMTVNMFMKFQLQNVQRAAKRADKSKDVIDYAMLDREFRLFQQAQQYSAQFMTQLGRGLRSLKDPISVPTLDEIRTMKQANTMMGKLASTDARGRSLVELLRGMNVADHAAAMARQIESANQSAGWKVMNSVQEVYTNALLSGPRTFLGLTVAGPAMMSIVQGLERAAGAAWTMNGRELSAVARNFKGMVLNTWTSMKYAAHAMMDEAPRFMDTGGLLDNFDARYAISAENYGVKSTPAAALINLAGQTLRSPSRVIMTVDEFFRQLHGRQAIFHEAYDKSMDEAVAAAREAGMITSRSDERVARRAYAAQAKREAEATVDRMVRDGQLRTKQVVQQEAFEQPAVQAETDPFKKAMRAVEYMQTTYNSEHQRLVKVAEDYATRAVFQSELGSLGRMGSAMLNAIPGGRIIVPFYRTPVNIMSRFGGWLPTTFVVEGIDRGLHALSTRRSRAFDGSKPLARQPILRGLHQKTMEDLLSADPRRVAEARGRQAFGVGVVGLGYFLAANGLLTGRGPQTEKKRRAWSRTNQPYSIKVGDEWVSYLKMDPIGMHFGLMADAFELLIASEFSGGINEEKQDLVTAMIYAFGQQVRKAPYLQGIANIMDAMENVENRGQTFVRNTLTSAMPFSGFQRQVLAAQDDAAFHEIRSLVDSYRARTWFGDSDDVPPARTPLGELLEVQPTNSATTRWANLVNPMMWMEESDDIVYETINDLGMVLDMPREVRDGINWRNETITGHPHSAYDYWMEQIGTVAIGGLTLRERLTEMFTPSDSKAFKIFAAAAGAGPAADGSSIAEQEIRKVITKYQTEAYNKMLQANDNELMPLRTEIIESQKDQKKRGRELLKADPSERQKQLQEILAR